MYMYWYSAVRLAQVQLLTNGIMGTKGPSTRTLLDSRPELNATMAILQQRLNYSRYSRYSTDEPQDYNEIHLLCLSFQGLW